MMKLSGILSIEELQRYQRQTVLSEFGITGQEQLKQARILCVGAGGLGVPALLYLVGAGIGKLGIVDMDTVDITNLQRQVLYTEADAGTQKVLTAAKRLQQLNKYTQIKAYAQPFSAKNGEEIMRDYDLVIDGTDNFTTKYLINDCAVKCGIPNVYGSILGFEGRLSLLWAKHGPCYRCLYPTAPKGYIPNCAEFGIIGAMAGIIGSAQAMEAIKWIAGKWQTVINQQTSYQSTLKTLLGKLWVLDAHNMNVTTVTIKKNPNCPVCSKDVNTIVLEDESMVCDISDIKTITVAECKDQIGCPEVIFLDVREQSEWQCGHIPNAEHFPLSKLMSDNEDLKKMNPNKTYIVYCQVGKRSKIAVKYLLQNGIINSLSLSGGISVWDGDIVTDNDNS
jgi:sulfur-carrier protein adenylyltransferase/sulfurtransferase